MAMDCELINQNPSRESKPLHQQRCVLVSAREIVDRVSAAAEREMNDAHSAERDSRKLSAKRVGNTFAK